MQTDHVKTLIPSFFRKKKFPCHLKTMKMAYEMGSFGDKKP